MTNPDLPILVVTGPIAGVVQLADGTIYSVTAPQLEVSPEHFEELAHHAEMMLEVAGDFLVPTEDPHADDVAFTHDRVACGHCPDRPEGFVEGGSMVAATNEASALLTLQNGGVYTAPTSVKVALCTGNPGTADAPANEVTGGTYAQQTVTWTTPSAGSCANAARVDFTGMPAGTVTYAARVGQYAAGNRQQFNGQLTLPVASLAGQTVSFLAGALTCTATG